MLLDMTAKSKPKPKRSKRTTKTKNKQQSEAGKKGGRGKWFGGKSIKEVTDALMYVWGVDGTDAEAASFAGISIKSLERYLAKHPELKEKRGKLRDSVVLAARAGVVSKIRGKKQITAEDGTVLVEATPPDVSLGWDYLRRKRRDEFADRSEHTGADGQPVEIKLTVRDFTKPDAPDDVDDENDDV